MIHSDILPMAVERLNHFHIDEESPFFQKTKVLASAAILLTGQDRDGLQL